MDDVVRDVLLLVQDGKLECISFPSWWDDVVRDAPLLVKEGKLECAIFPP